MSEKHSDTICGVRIDSMRCKGCGRCVAACRKGCLTLDTQGGRKSAAWVSGTVCDHCGACIKACPFEAAGSSL